MNINLLNSNQSFKGSFNYRNKKNTTIQISQLEGTKAENMTKSIIEGLNLLKKGIEEGTPDTFECTLDTNIYKKIVKLK